MLRRGERAVVIGAVVALALAALAGILSAPSPSSGLEDRRLSTYVAGPYGAKGLAQVLERLGVLVQRRRRPYFDLAEGGGRPAPQLLLAFLGVQTPTGPELVAIRDYVGRGGRIFVAGATGIETCFGYVLRRVRRGAAPDSAALRVPAGWHLPDTRPVLRRLPAESLAADDRCPLRSAAQVDTLLRTVEDRPVALRLGFAGGGEATLLADGRFLANRALKETDAGLAVLPWFLDGRTRRVTMDEYHLGFGGGASLPGALWGWLVRHPVGWAILQLAGVALVGLAVQAVRPRSVGGGPRGRGRRRHGRQPHRARVAAAPLPDGSRGKHAGRRRAAMARRPRVGAADIARARRRAAARALRQRTRRRGARARRRPIGGGRVGGASPAHDARRILEALQSVVLGQEAATREALICLLARGHVLLEGVPGTAKTLLVRTLALALQVRFQRIQFTPDLMPADITGVSLLSGTHEFTFRPGPIFADLVLADEINRAPAKTQAALLEAMQERTVTVDGTGHPLSDVFTVFATQNPIEFEGTYPLPEAELDRFMMKVLFGYPAAALEQGILARYVAGFEADRPNTYGVTAVMDAAGLERLRRAADAVRVEPQIMAYITSIIRATREAASLTLGASPRAGVALLKAARAVALLEERDYTIPDDVKRLAPAVLRHRVSVAPELELEGVTPDAALQAVLDRTEVPTA